MTEQLLPGLFKIDVPLPGSPLKALNVYLLLGRRRHLLIDNGYNLPECREALLGALAAIGADMEHMDFFLTHCHADHCGLTADLAVDSSAKVWCSAGDSGHIHTVFHGGEAYWRERILGMLPHGFRPEDGDLLVEAHPARKYSSSRALDVTVARHGDILEYGRYALTVVSTPGHTPDHLCLYEAKEELLFSGDHILDGITPNITRWRGFNDSLGRYLQSLEAIAAYPVRLTLPGHRALVPETRRRIAALQIHHAKRLAEVMEILRAGEADAYTVASRMQWAIRAASWNDFPVQLRWFACGEALAHLEHLAATGRAAQREQDGRILFAVTDSAG